MDDLFVLMVEIQLLCGETRESLRKRDAANVKRRRWWHPEPAQGQVDEACLQACSDA